MTASSPKPRRLSKKDAVRNCLTPGGPTRHAQATIIPDSRFHVWRETRGRASIGRAPALAFRLKLLLAAGLTPQLGACASCGEREHLVAFSGAAGGVVCGACEAGSFPLGEEAYAFMTEALGRPLTEAPGAGDRALGEVERAISATLEYHAHLRLMPAVGQWG